jgi:prepilin peptidase CpaA
MEQINIFSLLCALLLGTLLACACRSDARTRRIPNQLVLAGALAGLAINTFSAPGHGLFDAVPGGLGFLSALAGFGTGLGLLLPLYALRVMGAGDVKLMAMVGSFLGTMATLDAALMTFIAGGALALAVALRHGILLGTLANVRAMLTHALVAAMTGQGARVEPVVAPGAVTLPYAFAIAAGTCAQIVLARQHHVFFS